MNRKIYMWVVLIGFSILFFYGCSKNTQSKSNQSDTPENVISEELHQAHCDLLAMANEELALINQKVRDLNDKIQDGGKLSDAQNASLDAFEVKQASINTRMHEIKNIKQEDWENFKTTFESDLNEVKTIIDEVLDGF